ncbi:AraC family transcriptional regulator [Paenibacillus glycanilyticus]|uniref:helix-turn-helix transcriptional regulator n=1 Tax=Paenibacillus glycanilyticus TaxID=126569 RepID=UPI00203B2F63|nr:AraC family transcriptional regulator [Paenibacillus glycanilyticus]MCM3626853.1 AraC family transcriptional regulator [Paenibacillus glycanilyticus]
MEQCNEGFIISIDRFKPHTFQPIEGDGIFISHSHDYDELTLVLDGEGYYSSPEQNIKVGAGNLILIPPGLHHGFVSTVPWRGVSVHFNHDQLPLQSQYLFHAGYEHNRIHCIQLDEEDTNWAEISIGQLEREWKKEQGCIDSHNIMRIAFETAVILFQRYKTNSVHAAGGRNDQTIIHEVLKEIHARFYSQLTVHELASKHYVSESNLRKKFSEIIGVSPKQYMINLRVEEAKRLLRQTDKAIESISSEVGFTSSSRFYDFFVKAEGITPFEWRKQQLR